MYFSYGPENVYDVQLLIKGFDCVMVDFVALADGWTDFLLENIAIL